MNITSYAVSHKSSVYVLLLVLVILGINSYRVLPLESAPDIQIPIILIQTLYPGVAPQDIENLVTNILERELKDLRDVKEMSSTSTESASIITIEFETNVDMDEAYQKVRDKVDKAKPDLPDDAYDPMLIEINISDFPIMLINVSGSAGLVSLKKTAEDYEDRIEQIPGVLGVDVVGGLKREIQIFLNPERLAYYKIGVDQIIMRIIQEHRTTPAGNLELGGSKYTVRIPGEYKDITLLSDIVLKSEDDGTVSLADVGVVHDGFMEKSTISRTNKQESVSLRVRKRAGEDGIRIADQIRTLIDRATAELPKTTSIAIIKDESTFIRIIVSDLLNNIISGLLLVLLVLFTTMGLLNATFVAIAIPISMLIAFIVLRSLGITLNMVVLFSLILALGMLVDNSIVVVENIFRHASEGTPRELASLNGTNEVAWPIITSTLTTVVAFVPLLFWPGIMGSFMGFLPKTVIIALCASLFVAMVINPVFAANLLRVKPKLHLNDPDNEAGRTIRTYRKILGYAVDRPKRILVVSTLLLLVVFILFAKYGSGVEFFPNSMPERAQISAALPEGSALGQTDGVMKRIEDICVADNNVETTIANVGFGGNQFGGGGTSANTGIIDLEFKDRHNRTHSTWDTIENIRKSLLAFAGGEFKIDVEKHGPPTGAAVSIELSGKDYSILNLHARKIKDLIHTIDGIVDIKDDYETGRPEIIVKVDRERAKQRGLNTELLSYAIRTAINGTKVSVLREGEDETDIVVRFAPEYRRSISDLSSMIITGKDDVQVPLRDVALVQTTGGLGSIKHIGRKRTILISADVMGRSSSEIMIDVQKLLGEKVDLPVGYSIKYTGESAEQERTVAFLSEAFFIAILLILLILIAQFNSIIRPAIILCSVVMSLIGVILGLLITNSKFGIIMTGLGVISLAGIVVNNAIVLIDYTNQLRYIHGMHLRDALIKAGTVRFRPVMLTAITTILGLLPMAVGVNIDFTTLSIDPSSSTIEWWGPMARAVIFGLSFATVLTLIMVPVMYKTQENGLEYLRRFFRSAERVQ